MSMNTGVTAAQCLSVAPAAALYIPYRRQRNQDSRAPRSQSELSCE